MNIWKSRDIIIYSNTHTHTHTRFRTTNIYFVYRINVYVDSRKRAGTLSLMKNFAVFTRHKLISVSPCVHVTLMFRKSYCVFLTRVTSARLHFEMYASVFFFAVSDIYFFVYLHIRNPTADADVSNSFINYEKTQVSVLSRTKSYTITGWYSPLDCLYKSRESNSVHHNGFMILYNMWRLRE